MISVCIPAYRAGHFVTEALASVRVQSYSDWEVILTEDGGWDGAEERAQAFAREVCQSVAYNRHETNRGLPAARNTGIAAARGDWIAFLDADDLWLPDHLESLLARAGVAAPDVVFAGAGLVDLAGGRELGRHVPDTARLRHLPVALYEGTISILPSCAMVRRSSFSRFGPVSTDFPMVNDTELWLRILRGGGSIQYSGRTTCAYRQHGAAMSSRRVEMLAESARLCAAYADWPAIPRNLRRQRPAALYRFAARIAYAEGHPDARRLLRASLRTDPLNLKSLGLWLKFMAAGWP